MSNEAENLLRALVGMTLKDLLDPDRLPLGTGYLHPDSDNFLAIAKKARIPEANTKVFLSQVAASVWCFRITSHLDRDRDRYRAAINEIVTAIKRLVRALEYLDKHQYASFMLNKQFGTRLFHEWPDLMNRMDAFHRDKISQPVTEAVLNTQKVTGKNLRATTHAINGAIAEAMESEVAQIAGLKYQLKTLMESAQFLSELRLPKRGQNRTKNFVSGLLRIVAMNGGSLTYNKNANEGSLAEVVALFRASMPRGSWTNLSPSTLQRLKSCRR